MKSQKALHLHRERLARRQDDVRALSKLLQSASRMRSTNSMPLPWNDDAAREAAELGLKLLRLADEVAEAYERSQSRPGQARFRRSARLAHRLITDPDNADLRERLSERPAAAPGRRVSGHRSAPSRADRTICGDGFDAGRLFFVGDFKQSIYRFRGAEPPEFLKLREQVPEAGRLPLTHNFRSQPASCTSSTHCSATRFDEYEPLQPHRAAATNEPAVEFLWTITPQKNAHRQRQRAKRPAARKPTRSPAVFANLFDENCTETPVVDKRHKQARRVQPGDVAILFRTLSDVRVYEEALREYGLDYYLVGGHAFYAQQEIFDVLNLLRAVASTADEVSLAGVLRSPFFALADETLFWLVDSAGSLNAGLFADPLPPRALDRRTR